MKALIFAAGKGTRISRYIEGKPKCTLDIGGITLIEDTIKKLNAKGIAEIAVVLGYKSEVIKEILKEYNVTFYYNYFYDVTNSIASAWMARDFYDDNDYIIMNGDVFLEEKLLEQIMTETLSPVLFVDDTRKEEADYKFYYENNLLIKYGKDLHGDDISGEYIGVAKIGKDFITKFLEQLNYMITNSKHNVWWENVLYSMSTNREIYVKDILGKFWAEVDYIEDYQRILNFKKNSIK
jgi:choline kinase